MGPNTDPCGIPLRLQQQIGRLEFPFSLISLDHFQKAIKRHNPFSPTYSNVLNNSSWLTESNALCKSI